MKKKLFHILLSTLVLAGLVLGCIDESKFPLPYNNRTVGAYLRIYMQTSNILDLDPTVRGSTGFEAIFEPVDENNGDNTSSIEFYVTYKTSQVGFGTTREVFLKTVDVSGFTAIPEPTYSTYKRGTIRITGTEIETALAPLQAAGDPDGPGPIIGASPARGLDGYPGSGSWIAGDQIILRWVQVLSDGRRFTVNNPQATVNVAFVNLLPNGVREENLTPNITGGQFYSAPYTATLTLGTQNNQNAWTGAFTLRQEGNWSPSHSAALHESSYPGYMNTTDFQTPQNVTLVKPAGGLSTEREFTVVYRGAPVTMRINLEPTGPGACAACTTNMTNIRNPVPPIVPGFGFAPADVAALGTVYVPLANTGQDCTSNREFYWVTPLGGTFVGSTLMPLGTPQTSFYNRGVYSTTRTGTAAGDSFTIGIDDDCDEYGRRQGYCTWFRRITLSLVHQ